MAARITRHDGLPIDALPEAEVQDLAEAVEWLEGTHRPSYISGWRWGFIDGLCVGALLVALAFYLGWRPTP